MKKKLVYLLLIVVSFMLITFTGKSQVDPNSNYQLNLGESERIIENVISLELSDSQYESIQSVTGEKISLRNPKVIINGETIVPEEIHTRGNTTLYYKRKSFSFKLNSKATFQHGERIEKVKKFDVLSLSMDRYYTHNRLAFGMMEKIGLFNLFYTFCDLRINGKSEGIFMIVEKPQDWAMHKEESPFVIRRGYDHRMDKIELDKKIEKSEIRNYKDSYKNIYKSLNKYEGEELYNVLSEELVLEDYMKWLAFNFFVKNGDYSDEVFFYIDPDINKFRIIPWDYDDIFAMTPHEGMDKHSKEIGEKLMFSTEDVFDVKIASDPFLYNIYLKILKGVLNDLSSHDLKEIFEDTYAELLPYFLDEDIISQSQYDAYKNASLDKLKTEILSLYFVLNGTRSNCLEVIGSE